MQIETVRLTAWLEGSAAPVHEGVYARQMPAGPYSCFSGDRWFGDAPTPALAAVSNVVSPLQQVGWRGMATPPSGPCGTCRGHMLIDRGVDAVDGSDLIEECPDC